MAHRNGRRTPSSLQASAGIHLCDGLKSPPTGEPSSFGSTIIGVIAVSIDGPGMPSPHVTLLYTAGSVWAPTPTAGQRRVGNQAECQSETTRGKCPAPTLPNTTPPDPEAGVAGEELAGRQAGLIQIWGHHRYVVLFKEGRPTEPRHVRYGLSHGVPAFRTSSRGGQRGAGVTG